MNIFGYDYINMIRSIIPTAKTGSNNTEIIVRCPFCGDSKILSHAHFYMSVPSNGEDISMYHCKKCLAKGIVDAELLRTLGCTDSNILIYVTRHNTEVLNLPKYKTLKSIDVYPLKNDYIRDDDNNKYKLKYINDRIGSNFSYNDLLNLKIFLNLYDVINRNKLNLTRYKMNCDQLDRYFVGFISYDNSFCRLRKIVNIDINKYVNKRYINYTFVDKTSNKKNMYVIPTNIDVFSKEPIKIHIAEGQFDILSIYYNLNNCCRLNNIYIACNGKSYIQAVEFILQETGIVNYELHFYPDRDVSDYEFNNYLSRIRMLPCDIFIHRNMYNNEKDYGVPMNRIKDTVSVIREPYL